MMAEWLAGKDYAKEVFNEYVKARFYGAFWGYYQHAIEYLFRLITPIDAVRKYTADEVEQLVLQYDGAYRKVKIPFNNAVKFKSIISTVSNTFHQIAFPSGFLGEASYQVRELEPFFKRILEPKCMLLELLSGKIVFEENGMVLVAETSYRELSGALLEFLARTAELYNITCANNGVFKERFYVFSDPYSAMNYLQKTRNSNVICILRKELIAETKTPFTYTIDLFNKEFKVSPLVAEIIKERIGEEEGEEEEEEELL